MNHESVNKSIKLVVETQVCELSETNNVKLFEEKLEKAETEVKKVQRNKRWALRWNQTAEKAIKLSNDETKVQQKTSTELRKKFKQKERENYNLS